MDAALCAPDRAFIQGRASFAHRARPVACVFVVYLTRGVMSVRRGGDGLSTRVAANRCCEVGLRRRERHAWWRSRCAS